jgi:predicted ABC-type ATPase
MDRTAFRVLARYLSAGGLQDVSKLRWQAVFLMGAGGSGKGFYGHKWMKYMPGAPPEGYSREQFKKHEEDALPEVERGLTNINFAKAAEKLKEKLKKNGLDFIPLPATGDESGAAKMPFQIFEYDEKGKEHLIPRKDWEAKLPQEVFEAVYGLADVVFSAPKAEIPNYWRQVNPDLYKEELAGYSETQPGYVHEMSSGMAKAYFEAVLETGDPLFVDGTGSSPTKMEESIKAAKAAGYKVSIVFVYVPLTINHIRNAARSRNVDPKEVTSQWTKIQDSYHKIKGLADKAKIVDNRDDARDIALFKKKGYIIDDFIARHTEYANLYELIAKESPAELSAYGSVLKGSTASEDAKFEKWLDLQTRLKRPDTVRKPGEEYKSYVQRMQKKYQEYAGPSGMRNARAQMRRLWAAYRP